MGARDQGALLPRRVLGDQQGVRADTAVRCQERDHVAGGLGAGSPEGVPRETLAPPCSGNYD